MANLYDKAGLVNIPVGYQEGFLYNIKPEDNTLGFRFNRDSAATLVNSKGLIEQVGYFGPELVKNGNFSELGPELVVNGNFATDSDWTLVGSNVFISNNKLNFVNATTNSEFAQQFIVAPIGKTYKITLEVSNLGSGESIKIRHPFQDTTINTNGFHTIYGVGDLANLLRITPNSTTATFSIDNVSVKQVDPNDYWTLGTGWSFGDNKAVGVNATGNLQQSISVTSGSVYKVSFYVSEYVSGQVRLQTNQQNSIVVSANGDYVQYLTTTSDNVIILNGIDSNPFNGSITNISVVEVLGDKPRIDYTDSLTSPSFLLEPQSTNLLEFSEDFSQSYWTKNAISVSSGALASPDGTVSASKITEDSTINNHRIAVLGLTGSGTHTISVFAKANDRNWLLIRNSSSNAWFDVLNGVVGTVQNGSGSIENYGNGWYRCSVTMSSLNTPAVGIADNNDSYSYQGNGKGSLYIWGMQVEQLSYPTSYIPTAGSTVTRAQETCNGAGSASTFNSTEGVLYAEMAALTDDQTSRAITLSDGTTNNEIRLYFNAGSSNQIVAFLNLSGTYQCVLVYTSSDITQQSKIAFKYKQNDFSLYIDGVERATDTSGNTFSNNTLNKLSFAGATNLNNLYGKVKSVYVFNEALTDDELQQLTGPEYNSFAALAAAYNYTVI